MGAVDDVRALQSEARRLLGGFGFSRRQQAEMWRYFCESPAGVERCAEIAKAKGARRGRSGAGLLLVMLRAGEHHVELDAMAPIPTGWRFVRGTHSGTYVQDPRGLDPLPPGYGR